MSKWGDGQLRGREGMAILPLFGGHLVPNKPTNYANKTKNKNVAISAIAPFPHLWKAKVHFGLKIGAFLPSFPHFCG
jgi:hypothetical protein